LEPDDKGEQQIFGHLVPTSSSYFKSFIQNACVEDPEKRSSADELLGHVFVNDICGSIYGIDTTSFVSVSSAMTSNITTDKSNNKTHEPSSCGSVWLTSFVKNWQRRGRKCDNLNECEYDKNHERAKPLSKSQSKGKMNCKYVDEVDCVAMRRSEIDTTRDSDEVDTIVKILQKYVANQSKLSTTTTIATTTSSMLSSDAIQRNGSERIMEILEPMRSRSRIKRLASDLFVPEIMIRNELVRVVKDVKRAVLLSICRGTHTHIDGGVNFEASACSDSVRQSFQYDDEDFERFSDYEDSTYHDLEVDGERTWTIGLEKKDDDYDLLRESLSTPLLNQHHEGVSYLGEHALKQERDESYYEGNVENTDRSRDYDNDEFETY
jgi:hypothetical protein